MSGEPAFHRIRERLRSALDAGQLPDTAGDRGAQLLARLNTPVSVVVAGLAGSGKSSLINMLAGQPVIPEVPGLPVLEVTTGPSARSILVSADGTQANQPGNALSSGLASDVAMVRIELPLPILEHMAFVEIRIAGSLSEQQAALDLVVQRADIVLWCTEGFDDTEQALWTRVPDSTKDHAFLVLTKADRLLMKGELADRIASLQPVVAEEFHSLFPVATQRAIAARAGAGDDRADLWKASGGQALARAVMKQVATGRNADADNALLFLSRFGEAFSSSGAGDDDPTAAQPSSPPASDQPAMQGDPAKAALDYLSGCAGDLLENLPTDGAGLAGFVLDHCVATAEGVTNLLGQGVPADPDNVALKADIEEGVDMLILLQLEQTGDAAEDAVDLLLQMKKELAERAARAE